MTTFLNMEVSELPSTHKLCYLGGCEFTRASVAYDYKGDEVAANTPRFTHRVPDVTVRNLLIGNQSDGGDTLNPELLTLNQRTGTDAIGDATGFTAIGTTPAVIASSTAQFHSGSKSLRVDCAGDAAGEGVETAATTISNATAYIGGAWVYAPNGATMEISLYTNAESTPVAFTGTGAWQWVDTGAITSGTTTAKILVKTKTSGQDITFYVDDLRLAKNDTTGFSAYNGGNGTTTISITPETSYTGFRCVKVTNSGFTNQGLQLSVPRNNSMTFTAVVKGNAGVKLRLRMYQATTGWSNDTSFTANGEWQKISLTNTFPITGATWVYVSTDEAITTTFYVDQLMLETGSVAHDWAYGGSSYSTYKTVQGCLIEEAHTNIFTANQSTGTDTLGDITGFTGVGTVAATISSSTTQALQGTKSLKVVTTGTNTGEGVSTSSVNIANTTAHTQSLWVYAPTGSQLKLTATNQGATATAGTLVTGNGAWQQVTLTGTSSSTNTVITIATVGSAQAITFYVDMLQITATAYPLSWTLGGTTMAAETLTAPSSVYDLTSGTIELEAYANTVIKTNGINNYLLSTADGDGNNQISVLDDSSNNLTVTTKASDAATSVSYADSNLTSNTMFKVAAPYKSDKLKLFKDGTSVGTPLTSANLPTTKQTIYLGSKYDGTLQANTLIRNVVISKTKRTDEDVTARAESELPVADEHCTMIYPLVKDLSAYKVVAK